MSATQGRGTRGVVVAWTPDECEAQADKISTLCNMQAENDNGG